MFIKLKNYIINSDHIVKIADMGNGSVILKTAGSQADYAKSRFESELK